MEYIFETVIFFLPIVVIISVFIAGRNYLRKEEKKGAQMNERIGKNDAIKILKNIVVLALVIIGVIFIVVLLAFRSCIGIFGN